ncbi:MAG: arginine--tRNA ligase [Filifactoraceae bacterium]
MYLKKLISSEISKIISEVEVDEIEKSLEIPPNNELGDFAFPCFRLAKEYKKSPNLIASELASKLFNENIFEKIEAVGGYINIFINKYFWTKFIVEEVKFKKELYGTTNIGEGRNVIVEYSSPNIAKPFHIGHIRTTVIGHCLDNLYRAMGYNVTSINHLGDYGTQFGKLIVAYKLWGNRSVIEKNPIQELLKLYVRFHEEAEVNLELEQQAREWFKKLENDDKEAYDLWAWIREISLEEFNRVYSMLDINFDSFAGESFYSDKMPSVIETLNKKNILTDSEGAKIVDLEQYGMTPALITKKDGSSLYITRDIAAAVYRKEHYDFYKNIYVVGTQQELHFRQLKKVIELMGNDWAKDCVHVQFGTVALEEGTLSTRAGRVVFLEDVLNKAIEKTKEIIIEKNPNLPEIDEVAKKVGIGAIIFQELSNTRSKDYTFSWERTLSFEGETGPYVQYTYARCCSIMEKASYDIHSNNSYEPIADNSDAMNIIRTINLLEEILVRATEKYEPHHITRFALDLSQAFNKFYHDNKILNGEEKHKKAYLDIVYVTKVCIENCLSILGIKAPNRM